MTRVIKSLVAFFITVALLIILNTLLPSVKFLSSWWFMAIFIAISNFLIVYLTTPPRECKCYGTETKEYIMSGQGEIKEEVNDLYFSKMDLLEESKEGRSFININGSIVTTKYVTKEVVTAVKKVVFPNVIYTVFTACAMLVLLSGFCQQTKFKLSDVKTIGPAFEKCAVLIEKQMKPVSKNIKTLSKGTSQIKKEVKSSKKTIKKGFTQVGDNVSDAGKTMASSAKRAVKRIDVNAQSVAKGGRAVAKKFGNNFRQVMELITTPEDNKNGGK